jgi:hypothetical protein
MPSEKVDLDDVKAEILHAFGTVKFPGDWCLVDSREGDEPYRVAAEFSDKNDWRTLEPSFIDQAPSGLASALSFFSDEAFHFYLPAYLLADLDGKLERADPLFHLTHGLDESSRHEKINPRRYGERSWFDHKRHKFSMFDSNECKAIVFYLKYKRGDEKLLDSQRQQINEAIANYWYERAL